MKIFVIGFNKCGTKTIHEFFKKNQIPSYHIGDFWLTFKQRIALNLKEDKRFLEGYEQYTVFSDSEDIVDNYKLLDHQYPDSRFILNTRDINRWLVSRLNHGRRKPKVIYPDGRYCDFSNKLHNVNYTWPEWVEIWKEKWIKHHNDVDTYFKDKDNLLIFNIEQDKPIKIMEFLQDRYEINIRHWAKAGKTPKRREFFKLDSNGEIVMVKII